ncbi:MAG: hypothetical protein K1Y02_06275 [Candidatus Hydrogenedentes bacterium]|nr:hypothetical protein [Candidatus Hydrogenedentota bacterium]
MKRREFLHTASVAGLALSVAGQAMSAEGQPKEAKPNNPGKPTFRDIGWVWEGQGIDPQVPPSIYGLGQGARYFGLSRVNYLFHPNDVHALRLLQDYDEVVCDISKWGWIWDENGRPVCKPKSDPATVRSEGENVARLAKQFSNVTGVYCDDLLGLMDSAQYGPGEFANIRAAIRELNPALKLWSVVYTHEFEKKEFWAGMSPHMDVVTLWIWKSEDIVRMPEYVDQCRGLFPDKPIVMGVYLRDYTKVAPVPVDLVKSQMDGVAELVEKGTLEGYTILGAVLIDGHRPQADAVRDFINAHSV